MRGASSDETQYSLHHFKCKQLIYNKYLYLKYVRIAHIQRQRVFSVTWTDKILYRILLKDLHIPANVRSPARRATKLL